MYVAHGRRRTRFVSSVVQVLPCAGAGGVCGAAGVYVSSEGYILRIFRIDGMQGIAAKVIKGMEDLFGTEHRYNGVHLRMAVDASVFQDVVGGREGLWAMYKDVMKSADLDPEAPLFVASGLVQAGFGHPLDLGRLMFYAAEMQCHKVRAEMLPFLSSQRCTVGQYQFSCRCMYGVAISSSLLATSV
jgi:hypothetical protein